jgi:uncharacterized protein (TIGR02001 family)
MRKPAVQGTLDYSHKSGIYLGTFGSNVDGTSEFYNNTSMEWDFYGGYKGKLFPCTISDFSYSLGLIYYYYPGGQAKVPSRTRYNTGEFNIGVSYKWISIKYSQTITNYFGVDSHNPPVNFQKHKPDKPNGNSKGSSYIEANISFDLYEKAPWRFWCITGGKLNFSTHVGHVTVRHYEHLSYTDWNATLNQEFAWFNIFLTYVGTNARPAYYDVPDNGYYPETHDLGAQGVVFGVIKSF